MGLRGRRAIAYEEANHDYFGSIETDTQAYVLGPLSSDGNIDGEHNAARNIAARAFVNEPMVASEASGSSTFRGRRAGSVGGEPPLEVGSYKRRILVRSG